MKQTLITLAIVGTILTIMAFTNSDTKSVGAIGDVKYSVLPPDKFKDENGNGWVLMDNKIPLQGSDLNTKHGITALPDARGLFIRSLNVNRNDDKVDKFKEENNRERLMGEYQNDDIIEHSHSITRDTRWGQGNHYGAGWAAQDGHNGNSTVTTDGNPKGKETRPKNIALYTYIKIND